jgi:signal transduction histidine kinase/ActR/RegA family two-component response regulator
MIPTHRPPATNPRLHLEAEAAHQLYLGVERVVPFMPVLPLALVLGLWAYVDTVELLAWLVAALTMPACQLFLARRYRAHPPERQDAARWARYVTWTSLVEGIVWGAAGILFFVPNALPPQLILLGLIIGMPAGSIFPTSWWPASFYTVAYSEVGLTALGLALRGKPGEIEMAVALGIYMVMLHQMMRQAHTVVMETLALRFENGDLVEQLRQEKLVAEQANIAKSKFLAAASHDLRQPLHALALFAQLLDERARDPDTRFLVGKIQHCAVALDSLFHSLLDLSKMDAGIVSAKNVHFPVAPLVERLHAEYAPQAEAAGLRLLTHCGELTAKSDPIMVERILRNLIANAIRYTRGGEIVIDCTTVDAGIALEVRDTGIGIPEDQHEHVFQEFVQLGNPEHDRSNGLGLGLSIVRRLAHLLGTQVELQSTPGVGSSFRFALPAGNPEAIIDSTEMPSLSPSALTNALIAVIDDEADVREGMRMLLEHWGCRVIAAEDSASLVAALDQSALKPDVLVADFRLREANTGLDAIRHIESHCETSIPSLIITGDTAPERLSEARSRGSLLLHKPVPPAKLRAALQSLRTGSRIENPIQPPHPAIGREASIVGVRKRGRASKR